MYNGMDGLDELRAADSVSLRANRLSRYILTRSIGQSI